MAIQCVVTHYNRIPPTGVPALFRQIGKVPTRANYGSAETSYCCVWTAFAIANGPSGRIDFSNGLEAMARKIGLSKSACHGLIAGWDGWGIVGIGRDEQWRRGHAYGRAAWKACRSAGLVGEAIR